MKEFTKNLITTSAGTIGGMVFQFLSVILMTRYMTKTDFGLYVIVMLIINILNILSSLGTELTIVKFLSSSESNKNNIAVIILIVRIISFIFFSISFLMLINQGFLEIEYFSRYSIQIILILLVTNLRDYFYNFLQGINKFKEYSIVNISSSFFRFVILTIFIFLSKYSLFDILLVEILATIQPLIHQLYFIRNYELNISKNFLAQDINRIIRFSFPLYLNNIIVFLSTKINTIVLTIFLSPIQVANFDVAEKIPFAFKKILSSFIIVYFPTLSNKYSIGDFRGAKELVSKSIYTFSIIMYPIILISFLFKSDIVLLLFSNKYAESINIFSLLILNFFFLGISDIIGYSFTPASLPKLPSIINFISLIINVILSFWLIPTLGLIGAPISLIIMNLISIIISLIFSKRYNIKPNLYFLRKVIFFNILNILLLISLDGFEIFLKILIAMLLLMIFLLTNAQIFKFWFYKLRFFKK
ncbi:MAG: oligosaccharide flippase family protein [Ignavibacterium sp.]|jgi:O-antigen/teichoic acid export membrane protein|uniref:oligosaccharide flippase family protein n=1 Tax=Ignavibacterium sp. TaxID=2651167 RepID=UPI0032985FED